MSKTSDLVEYLKKPKLFTPKTQVFIAKKNKSGLHFGYIIEKSDLSTEKEEIYSVGVNNSDVTFDVPSYLLFPLNVSDKSLDKWEQNCIVYNKETDKLYCYERRSVIHDNELNFWLIDIYSPHYTSYRTFKADSENLFYVSAGLESKEISSDFKCITVTSLVSNFTKAEIDNTTEQNNSAEKNMSNQEELFAPIANYTYGQPTILKVLDGEEDIASYTLNLNKVEMTRAISVLDYGELTLINPENQERKTVLCLYIPKAHLKYKRTSKSVLMCAYNATEAYFKTMLGRALTNDDANWYKAHPKTVAGGLPHPFTFTTLNDLVAPYGIGVSKIYIKKGQNPFPETRLWEQVLGVNPAAAVTRDVTNSEFAETLGGVEMAAKLGFDISNYNLEYVDELPPGKAYVGMAGGFSGSGFGAGGGHATFYGPRAICNSWVIALQYDLISNCKWLQEPPSYEYVEEFDQELDLGESLVCDGTTIKKSIYNNTYISFKEGMYFTAGHASNNSNYNNYQNNGSHTRKSNFVGSSPKDLDNIYDLSSLDILQDDSNTEKKNLQKDNRSNKTDNKENSTGTLHGEINNWLKEFNQDQPLSDFSKLTAIDNFMLRASPIVNDTSNYNILKNDEVNSITLQHYIDVFLPSIGIDITDKNLANEHNITVADVMITLTELSEAVKSSTFNLVYCDSVDTLKPYIESGECSLPVIITDNDHMVKHFYESFYGENKLFTVTGLSHLFNKLTVAEMYALLYEINNVQFTHYNEKLTCYMYAQFAIFIALGGNIRTDQIENIKDKYQISK
jgi:hypothetical protein